jgi:16S rRNA C1402 (ribose-2'-O) methylase RsmI
MPYKVRVIGVSHLKTAANAGGNNTVQVFNGASAITGAIVASGNDQVLQTTGFSIDDAQMDVAAASLLKVTSTKVGTNSACIVYVTVLRVA